MKFAQFVALALLLCCPFMMSAQSIVGAWSWDTTSPNGETGKTMVVFQKDGVYKVDVGMDGSYEIEGTYTFENGQATITDTSEGPCKGLKGVYEMKVERSAIKAKMISDACEARRSEDPNDVLVMKKVM